MSSPFNVMLNAYLIRWLIEHFSVELNQEDPVKKI